MIKIRHGHKAWDFASLLAISDACYENDERPTPTEFEQMISISEVFIATEALSDRIKGFAIVKEVGENTSYLWSIAVPPIINIAELALGCLIMFVQSIKHLNFIVGPILRFRNYISIMDFDVSKSRRIIIRWEINSLTD